jgi:hypothetical protein
LIGVSFSTNSKEVEPNYWMNSFIYISGGNASFKNCNFINMACISSAVDLDGPIK